jgi:hypothetical protein
MNGQGQPLLWAWDLVGGARQKTAVQSVAADAITYQSAGGSYQLKVAPGAGSCQRLDDESIRLSPNSSGKLVMNLGLGAD